jgi:ABC-type Fe3+ transport system permease subunit
MLKRIIRPSRYQIIGTLAILAFFFLAMYAASFIVDQVYPSPRGSEYDKAFTELIKQYPTDHQRVLNSGLFSMVIAWILIAAFIYMVLGFVINRTKDTIKGAPIESITAHNNTIHRTG